MQVVFLQCVFKKLAKLVLEHLYSMNKKTTPIPSVKATPLNVNLSSGGGASVNPQSDLNANWRLGDFYVSRNLIRNKELEGIWHTSSCKGAKTFKCRFLLFLL